MTCLIWTEMTVKYGIHFNFSCQQGGDIPPCGAKWGSGPLPPPQTPLAETLCLFLHSLGLKICILAKNWLNINRQPAQFTWSCSREQKVVWESRRWLIVDIDNRGHFNPLSPHDALKHHFASLKTQLIFSQLRVLEEKKLPWNCFTNTCQFS